MAENKKSFVAYCDWGEIFDELSDQEAGKLVKHLFDYVRDSNPESDRTTELLFIQIKQSLKRDLKKYSKYIDKQKINGAKGGRPKKPKKPKPFSENPSEPKKADSVNVSVSDNVNDNVSVIENKMYSKEIHDSFQNILNYFPDHLHPKKEDTWLDVIEKLNRIEKLPFEIIEQIVKKTRADDFWSKNFLALPKLRKKNKDGILYVVVFNEQIKTNGTSESRRAKFLRKIEEQNNS